MKSWILTLFSNKIQRLIDSEERNEKFQKTLTQTWFKTIDESKSKDIDILSNEEISTKHPHKRKNDITCDNDTNEIIPSKKIKQDKDFNINKIDEMLCLLQNIDKKIDNLMERISKVENQSRKK
ncbi:hypothetical protein RFI_00324 [Reticulomyxa filosa]|uniref:Uncharacterized protein n=1 Tax=Reticulomyxa filosa TaxID=46433 RepID=X6PEV1_RETFI|nr:hypothetical protein RFI_00324 [Reticulomyxa filosa]|eukprot:ETO36736.1 hypothetical protein RFI_00324 [Reticulomyxa filosa]